MTTITEAVERLKNEAMILRDTRTTLRIANKELQTAEEQEEDARKKYAVALSKLEELTGASL
ncbi:MAG: hypothetical protein ACXQTR_01910 [Candidatus Methanospirareceae archaeon]